MRKFIHIAVLFCIYIVLCGKSCREDGSSALFQEKEIQAEKEFIRDEFEADWLDEASRHAYELAAIQKLGDLADYMNVLGDRSLDQAFREKAGEMTLGLFASGDATVWEGSGQEGEQKALTVNKMVQEGHRNESLLSGVRFDSVMVLKPLQQSGHGQYRGSLAGYRRVAIHTGTDTVQEIQPVEVEVLVNRIEKVFGPDTLDVWEVFLGNLSTRK